MFSVQTVILVNIALVVGEIILAFILANMSSRYRRSTGYPDREERYKMVVLWTVVLMAFLALGAALFNLFFV
jgi:ABC-type amino acid transport system permease subunit